MIVAVVVDFVFDFFFEWGYIGVVVVTIAIRIGVSIAVVVEVDGVVVEDLSVIIDHVGEFGGIGMDGCIEVVAVSFIVGESIPVVFGEIIEDIFIDLTVAVVVAVVDEPWIPDRQMGCCRQSPAHTLQKSPSLSQSSLMESLQLFPMISIAGAKSGTFVMMEKVTRSSRASR